MIVGVIGSGSIGPDLAYGFVSAIARAPGSKVYLNDIRQEALDAGVQRIEGYIAKGVARGQPRAKAAAAARAALVPTLELSDLADCDYVLEAASENLDIKRAILGQLEAVVRPDCLIGFATSGIPRARIAAEAQHPSRCFVNHPFFPAWRTLPIEVVLSDDDALGARMIATLERLGGEGWELVYELDNPIGARRRGSNITLEPGCQLELSTRPFPDLTSLRGSVDCELCELSTAAAATGSLRRSCSCRCLIGLRLTTGFWLGFGHGLSNLCLLLLGFLHLRFRPF